MTRHQDQMRNPFNMDEHCPNCPELVDSRAQIVHGYGDVTAEFVVIAENPDTVADQHGHPVARRTGEKYTLRDVLEEMGVITATKDERKPRLKNAFVTHLARCHHPKRPPSDEEIQRCEPFLNAEIRTINPEIIIPIGTRALRSLAFEYTTTDPTDLEVTDCHGEELRGRGFELLPMIPPSDMSADAFESFIAAIDRIRGRDYRQTKGRQGR